MPSALSVLPRKGVQNKIFCERFDGPHLVEEHRRAHAVTWLDGVTWQRYLP